MGGGDGVGVEEGGQADELLLAEACPDLGNGLELLCVLIVDCQQVRAIHTLALAPAGALRLSAKAKSALNKRKRAEYTTCWQVASGL